MQQYVLPVAAANRLGGIKVGDDFTITEDGTLNIKDISDLQEQIDALNQQVTTGKALVAQAITEKKVETASDASFQTMADNIRSITGGVSYERVSYTLEEKGFTKQSMASTVYVAEEKGFTIITEEQV